MKKLSRFLISLLPLAVTGCLLPSVYSLYDGPADHSLVYVPELLGTWKAAGSKETWTFEPGEADRSERYYKLTYKQSSCNKAVFAAHFVQLNQNLFLDLFNLVDEKKRSRYTRLMENKLMRSSLYSVHIFAKVNLSGNNLHIIQFFPSQLDSLNKLGTEKLDYAEGDGGYILTSKPLQLQKFLTAHADDKGCFRDNLSLKKTN